MEQKLETRTKIARQSPPRPRAKGAAYPSLNGSTSQHIWLVTYLRNIAELEQLEKLKKSSMRQKNVALQHALIDACCRKEMFIEEFFFLVLAAGQLLFAFKETTALEQGGAL